ncbi:MAG TPA: DUF2232 domain-containing protein [bacterium]|nr:DUF2232 domain-containing protein [bacterium]
MSGSIALALAANLITAALLVLPAAVAIFTVRHGPRGGLLMIAPLVALAGFTAGPTGAAVIAASMGGVGLALWHYGRRPIRLETLFAGLASIFLLGTVGIFFLAQFAAGVSPLETAYVVLDQIHLSFDAYTQMLTESVGSAQLDRVQQLEAAKAMWVWGMFRLAPSLAVIAASVLVLVNFLLVRNALPVLFGLELNRWRAPDTAIWAVLGPGLGLLPYLILNLLKKDTGDVMTIFYVSLNLLIIGLVPYLIQGLAVMSFFLKRWRLPRFLRGLTYFIILSQGLVPMVAALGLMEFWTDFRGRALVPRRRPNDEENQ